MKIIKAKNLQVALKNTIFVEGETLVLNITFKM